MKLKSNSVKGLSQIEKKYNVQRKGRQTEELNQRLAAKAAKLKRNGQRLIDQYRQNIMFQLDQKKLYQELEGATTNNVGSLDWNTG